MVASELGRGCGSSNSLVESVCWAFELDDVAFVLFPEVEMTSDVAVVNGS